MASRCRTYNDHRMDIHPCLQQFGRCRYGDQCEYKYYPKRICLHDMKHQLKNKARCIHGSRCSREHVNVNRPIIISVEPCCPFHTVRTVVYSYWEHSDTMLNHSDAHVRCRSLSEAARFRRWCDIRGAAYCTYVYPTREQEEPSDENGDAAHSESSEDASGTTPTEHVESTGPQEEESTQEPIVQQSQEEVHCAVCYDKKKDHLLVPCMHMCLCEDCATRYRTEPIETCPMCRAHIRRIVRVIW